MNQRVNLLESDEDLESLAADWRRLAELAGNPFASPEWFRCVLEDAGPHWRPAVFVVTGREDDVAGVLPFIRPSARERARLVLAGAGTADMLSPAANRDESAAVAAAVAAALPRLGCRGPMELGRVEAGAEWWRLLCSNAPGRRITVSGPPDLLPFISLPASWNEYRAGRSRGFRSELGRKMRGLRAAHDVEIRLTKGGPALAADLESLFRLHHLRWSGRGSDSSLGARSESFHRRFAAAAASAGWVRLYLMEIDGRPAAAWYGWRVGARTLYYQAGFDPEWRRYSLGFLLLAETIKGAIEEGCDIYDMLLGDERFKARFSSESRTGHDVGIVGPLSISRLRVSARHDSQRIWRALPESVRERGMTQLFARSVRR